MPFQGSNGRSSRSRSTKSGGGGSGGGRSSSSRSKGSGDKSGGGSGKSDRGKSRRKRDDNGGGGGGGGTGEKSSKSTPSNGESPVDTFAISLQGGTGGLRVGLTYILGAAPAASVAMQYALPRQDSGTSQI